jgi:hypothetical protein
VRFEKVIDDVIAANPKQVEQYKSGKTAGARLPGGSGDEGIPWPGRCERRERPAQEQVGLGEKNHAECWRYRAGFQGADGFPVKSSTSPRTKASALCSISTRALTRRAAPLKPASFAIGDEIYRKRRYCDWCIARYNEGTGEVQRVKFGLNFTLLADAEKDIAILYGVLKEKNMYGKKVMGVERTTFLIGPDGKIEKIFNKVKAEGHAAEVLAAPVNRKQKRAASALF